MRKFHKKIMKDLEIKKHFPNLPSNDSEKNIHTHIRENDKAHEQKYRQ